MNTAPWSLISFESSIESILMKTPTNCSLRDRRWTTQLCWVRTQIWKLIKVVRPLQQQVLALASLSTSKTRIKVLTRRGLILKRVSGRLTIPVGTVMALTGRRPSPNTKQLTTLQLVSYIINNKLESMTRLWREAKPSLVWTSISFSWTRIRTIQQLKKL